MLDIAVGLRLPVMAQFANLLDATYRYLTVPVCNFLATLDTAS